MPDLPVYLDNNATTSCDPRVVAAMLPYFTKHFGNAASRSHAFGWQANAAVELAREQVAVLVGATPGEIVFTSGATESINLAIKGATASYSGKGNHLITAVTEHKAVLDACRHLEKTGTEVTYLPVNREGLIDPADVEAAIRPATVLIALMYANNETGVIQPISEIAVIAKKHGVLFFSDITQAAGKVPVDVITDDIDMAALSAHKMYGPKGVGALYVRRKNPRVKLVAQIDGGGHEKGMRSGTLNVPGIVGFGKATALCSLEMEDDGKRLSVLRNRLETALAGLPETRVNGSTLHRLPQVTNLSFAKIDSEQLIIGIQKEIAVSSGSACTSATPEPSYVLKAMGLDNALARGSVRFGLGRFTTPEEIDYVIDRISETVGQLRQTEGFGRHPDAQDREWGRHTQH